jgi:hypothetical protein
MYPNEGQDSSKAAAPVAGQRQRRLLNVTLDTAGGGGTGSTGGASRSSNGSSRSVAFYSFTAVRVGFDPTMSAGAQKRQSPLDAAATAAVALGSVLAAMLIIGILVGMCLLRRRAARRAAGLPDKLVDDSLLRYCAWPCCHKGNAGVGSGGYHGWPHDDANDAISNWATEVGAVTHRAASSAGGTGITDVALLRQLASMTAAVGALRSAGSSGAHIDTLLPSLVVAPGNGPPPRRGCVSADVSRRGQYAAGPSHAPFTALQLQLAELEGQLTGRLTAPDASPGYADGEYNGHEDVGGMLATSGGQHKQAVFEDARRRLNTTAGALARDDALVLEAVLGEGTFGKARRTHPPLALSAHTGFCTSRA